MKRGVNPLRHFCASLIAITIFLCSTAHALTIEKTLENPKDEARAQEIFRQIRCMVCSGESIADSRADLAGNMREVIRSKVSEGMGDKQIVEYLTSRYGNEILMQPPLQLATYLLWFGPVLILLCGIGGVVCFLRGRKNHSP